MVPKMSRVVLVALALVCLQCWVVAAHGDHSKKKSSTSECVSGMCSAPEAAGSAFVDSSVLRAASQGGLETNKNNNGDDNILVKQVRSNGDRIEGPIALPSLRDDEDASADASVDASSTSSCSGTCQTTSIRAGGKNYHPTPTGYYCSTSTKVSHHASITSAPASSDLDLYLLEWNAAEYTWVVAAASAGPTSNEAITFSSGAGCFSWEVYSYDSAVTYTLDMVIPSTGTPATTAKAATAKATTMKATTTAAPPAKSSATTAASVGSGVCTQGSTQCNCDPQPAGILEGPANGDGCLMDDICTGGDFYCNVQIGGHTFCCASTSSACNVTTDANFITTCNCGYTGTALPGELHLRDTHRRWRGGIAGLRSLVKAKAADAAANFLSKDQPLP